jgi:outer membrane lipoprotein SlyB
MKPLRVVSLMLLFTLGGCYATTTTATTTYATAEQWGRPGQVAYVREVVHRQHGDPAGGAVAGAIIGGLLGGRGEGAVLGAIGGAVIGAAASSGSSETRIYEVAVRYDDGGFETYGYQGYTPFSPGQPVVLTPQGLSPR